MWLLHGDDWEFIDNIPRWVWRADDLFSKMSREEATAEVPRVAKRLLALYGDGMDRLLGMRPQPGGLSRQKLHEWWLAKQLEECRRKRNLTTGVLKEVNA